jgi:methionine-rich copper-binding protein CopC
VLVLLAALSGGLAPAAWAHDELVSSSPRSGATVAPPGALTLTYSERLVDTGYRVVVRGPAGVVRGDVRVDGERVVSRFPRPLAAGPYDVVWRVVSADGHPVSGRLSFTVRAPAGASGNPTSSSPSVTSSASTTSTAASPSESTAAAQPTSGTGGSGRGALVAAIVVAALVAGAAALALSRRNRPRR